MSHLIERPALDEYASWSANYVELAGEGDILEILARQVDELAQTLAGLSEQDALFRFAPMEWTIKEVVGHVCDVERIFFYRTLCISRNETVSLPGFDQDDYVRGTNFNEHNLGELIQEFQWVRRANLLTLKHFSTAVSLRRGTVNGSGFSVRGLVYCLAGHVYYHLHDLRTQYLPPLK